jgi:hypothetical protein
MAVIGVEPLVLEYIWLTLGNTEALSKRCVLLWVFYFMKNYTSLHSTALFFRRTVPHFHQKLWAAIEYLAENLDEVIIKIINTLTNDFRSTGRRERTRKVSDGGKV